MVPGFEHDDGAGFGADGGSSAEFFCPELSSQDCARDFSIPAGRIGDDHPHGFRRIGLRADGRSRPQCHREGKKAGGDARLEHGGSL